MRTLMHVSYDPTREVFAELNPLFIAAWQRDQGEAIRISMSHGGSGRQARAVADGLEADVVTLATDPDVEGIVRASSRIDAAWRTRLPEGPSPWYSTVVFVVRAGNPKNIVDFGDLVRDDVRVVTPNPKTSGGARYNYLAAWGWALAAHGGDTGAATAWMARLFARVPVLDAGARGATTTFVQNGIGDVLLTWENEAYMLLGDVGRGRFEMVVPPRSIRAECPATVVDAVADRRGTRDLAEAYLRFLYSEEAQRVLARYHYRPTHAAVAHDSADAFPAIELFDVESLGGWDSVHALHFAQGALFDTIYQPEG